MKVAATPSNRSRVRGEWGDAVACAAASDDTLAANDDRSCSLLLLLKDEKITGIRDGCATQKTVCAPLACLRKFNPR